MSNQSTLAHAALRSLMTPVAIYMLGSNTAMAQNPADFALGGHNICVVDTEGRLECTTRFESNPYLPLDDGALYKSVTSGDAHSCAITQNGDLRCWGLNNFGQQNVPPSTVDWISVATAESHTCAVDANLQAHC